MHRCNPPIKRGIAVVELALLLPILATIVFATIECCSVIRIKQRLGIMAYESARIAVLSESSIDDVRNQCQLLCDDDGLTGFDVSLSPANLGSFDSGQWVTATVTLPLRENSAIGGWFFPSNLLAESVSIQSP